MEYDGATYISQTEAPNHEQAMIEWVNEQKFDELVGEKISAKTVIADLEESNENPVSINGMQNVWCICFDLKDKLALVHYTQTERS